MIPKIQVHINVKNIHRNPYSAFNDFSTSIRGLINKNKQIDTRSFYAGFKTFAEICEKQEKTQKLTSMSRGLIEHLVSKGYSELAGIAYSILIKLNENNPEILKSLALNALAIAKRDKDPIHIAARAMDLVKLYSRSKDTLGCEEHIKYLRIANHALTDICKNYEITVANRYNRISRDMKPLENYEFMLCTTKLDIIKYTYKQDPYSAKDELVKAKALLEKNMDSKNMQSKEILSRKIADRQRLLDSWFSKLKSSPQKNN